MRDIKVEVIEKKYTFVGFFCNVAIHFPHEFQKKAFYFLIYVIHYHCTPSFISCPVLYKDVLNERHNRSHSHDYKDAFVIVLI